MARSYAENMKIDPESRPFDPPAQSSAKSVGRGALVTGGAQVVKLGCQIISVVVMSRLLQPADFGIVAMAAPVIAFVGLFQDMGLTQATVQKAGITRNEVSSLFWINMMVSILLATFMILISPLVGRFYAEPQVEPLVAAMSLQLLIMGLGAQHYALITRRMDFGRLAIIDSFAAVLGLGTAIAWAYFERTYWALFIGGLTTMTVSTLGCWLISRWRPGLPRWVSGTGSSVKFGAGITGFNFANYFSRNVDHVLIGRQWGNEQLGLYDRANRLLLFPLSQFIYPLGKVMVPALSRMADDPDRYRQAYLRVAPLLLFASLPGIAVAIAMADLLIPLALGEQWRGAVVIFHALGFVGMLSPLNSPAGWLFISQGRSMDFMRWGIFGAITTAAAFALGLPYGAFGIALACAVHEYLRTPLLWLYVGRSGPIQARHILRATLPFVLGAHIAMALLWLIKDHLMGGTAVILITGLVLSYLIVACVALQFAAGRATMKELRMLVRTMLPATRWVRKA